MVGQFHRATANQTADQRTRLNIRQPPEKVADRTFKLFVAEHRPWSRLEARERMVHASMASSLPWTVAMAWLSLRSLAAFSPLPAYGIHADRHQ